MSYGKARASFQRSRWSEFVIHGLSHVPARAASGRWRYQCCLWWSAFHLPGLRGNMHAIFHRSYSRTTMTKHVLGQNLKSLRRHSIVQPGTCLSKHREMQKTSTPRCACFVSRHASMLYCKILSMQISLPHLLVPESPLFLEPLA